MERERRMKAGQDIIMTGYIGLEGTLQAVEKLEDRLSKKLPRDFLEKTKAFRKDLSLNPGNVLKQCGYPGPVTTRAVEKGGIFAALWEMGHEEEVGLTIYFKKIPVRQETIEICEILEWNPYELLSGGCELLVVDNANDVVDLLRDGGIPAVFVGKVTDSKDRILVSREGVRYLNRPEPDAILGLDRLVRED